MTIATEKQILRQMLKEARLVCQVQYPNAALQIIPHIQSLITPASCIGAYWPMGSELNIIPLLETLHNNNHHICLPRVRGDNASLSFHQWIPGDALEQQSYGFQAPRPGTPLCMTDYLLIPLLGFDERCHRLGYGQGHYDRTLTTMRAQTNILAIGIAFDEQKIDTVPTEPHDQCLDAIVTPSCIYLCNKI